jgi:hypothetical protein
MTDLGPAWRHTARGPVPAWHGATAGLHIAEIADLDTPHLNRTVRLARRADPIDRLALPADVLAATYRWRGAWERLQAVGSLRPVGGLKGSGGGAAVRASYGPERACAAARTYRIGMAAIGRPAQPLVLWVVCLGRSTRAFETMFNMRHGTSAAILGAALERLGQAPFDALEESC